MKVETILNAHTLTVYMISIGRQHNEGRQHHDRRYRQRDAFRARILRMDEDKDALLLTAAEVAYHNDVVATGMERDMIGGDNYEYADKEDWIESWLYGLTLCREIQDD